MPNFTPECWAKFEKCMDEWRDTKDNPCRGDCYGKYHDPSVAGELKPCTNCCGKSSQAAYDICKDVLNKCSERDPGEKQRYEERQKKRLDNNGSMVQDFGGVTFATGLTIGFTAAALEIPLAWAACGIGVAVIGGGLFLAGGYAIAKAVDPIDNKFKSLARPRPPNPYVVKAEPGTPLTADVAKAINAVLENQAKAIGLDRALMTSVDRAQGAGIAKKREYEKFQMENARKYAGDLAILLRESAGLRSIAVKKLRENGVVFSITEDQAFKIRRILVETGVPPKFKRILSRYCENDSEKRGVLLRYLSQLADVHKLEVTFPNFLSNPKLASAEKKIASTLDEFSHSTYISL